MRYIIKNIYRGGCCLILANTVVISLAGCQSKKYDNNYWMISDSGSIHDHSFNETIYQGVNQYVQQLHDDNNIYAQYIEPSNAGSYEFNTALDNLKIFQAQIGVFAGWRWSGYTAKVSQSLTKAVMVDTSTDPIPSNITCLKFNSSVSGFIAAIAAALYFNYNIPTSKVPLPKFATFGGLSNDSAVSNYMWGFICGISFWNYLLQPAKTDQKYAQKWKKKIFQPIYQVWNQLNHSKQKKMQWHPIGWAPSQGSITATGQVHIKATGKSTQPTNWFSQSFAPGGAKNLVNKFMQNNVNCIFPVAGIQILDVLQAIKNSPNKTYQRTIGVDIPQENIFDQKYIICSAIKKMDLAVDNILKKITANNKDNKFLGKIVTSDGTKEHRWDWDGISFQNHAQSGMIATNIQKYLLPNNHIITPAVEQLVQFYQKITNKSHNSWSEVCHISNQLSNQNWGQYIVKQFTKNE